MKPFFLSYKIPDVKSKNINSGIVIEGQQDLAQQSEIFFAAALQQAQWLNRFRKQSNRSKNSG
jgi:hypothetical protein